MAAIENIIIKNDAGETIPLADYLEAMNKFIFNYHGDSILQADGVPYNTITAEPGNKFIKIVSNLRGGHSRSVHHFIDYKGNIYKAAGWKAPAKGIRGSIFDVDYSLGRSVGAYGAAYIRGPRIGF